MKEGAANLEQLLVLVRKGRGSEEHRDPCSDSSRRPQPLVRFRLKPLILVGLEAKRRFDYRWMAEHLINTSLSCTNSGEGEQVVGIQVRHAPQVRTALISTSGCAFSAKLTACSFSSAP